MNSAERTLKTEAANYCFNVDHNCAQSWMKQWALAESNNIKRNTGWWQEKESRWWPWWGTTGSAVAEEEAAMSGEKDGRGQEFMLSSRTNRYIHDEKTFTIWGWLHKCMEWDNSILSCCTRSRGGTVLLEMLYYTMCKLCVIAVLQKILHNVSLKRASTRRLGR